MYRTDLINGAMGANRLTNEKVAAIAGVAPKVISAVRNGKVNITLHSLKAVAEAVGFEVEIRFNPKSEQIGEARPEAA
jgi:transcriptional regulator with XRE-family HTH domain